MIEKIFDVKDKLDHNKKKKYLTIILKTEQYKPFKALLDKIVKIYDYDVVHGTDTTTMSIVMNHERYLKFLDEITSIGYAIYAYPNTRILYTLVKM